MKADANVDFPLPDGPAIRTVSPCPRTATARPSGACPSRISRGSHPGQVVLQHPRRQLRDPAAVLAGRHEGDALLDRGEGVGHRHRALAEIQETVVVLGVADADHVVERQPQLLQGGAEARPLVDAGWQDHHGVPVEDDLQLQAQVANGFEHDRLVRPHRGHDDPSELERSDAALGEQGDELRRYRLGEGPLFLAGRSIENGPVLGDHAVEEVEGLEQGGDVGEQPAGDEEELPARLAKAPQGVQGRLADVAVGGQRRVVVARQRVEPHVRASIRRRAGGPSLGLPGNLGSLLARFGEPDRDRLLAAGHALATSAAQGSLLPPPHGGLDRLAGTPAVTSHEIPPR
jgi:hypothetical protein